MRIYETDDVKALPGDIVREQDFIMRLRHLYRQRQPCSIFNIVFGGGSAPSADIEKREAVTRALTAQIAALGGQAHAMSQGDIFIIAPHGGAAANIRQSVAAALARHGLTDQAPTQEYRLPQDYAAIRECANHYIEAARAAAQIGMDNAAPEVALQGELVRGILTPWALDQIVRLFAKIDIRRYVRSQHIYRLTASGWQITGTEYFVSVEELRRERFPRLDIRTPERLFMELCGELDYRLLNAFAENPGSLAGGTISLNIAVESVLGAPFAKFLHTLPPPQRAQMTFEINRGEILMNFEATMAAIETLHREGFRVALDALHPSMLPVVHCDRLGADILKIRASKDILPQLQAPGVMEALRQIPREKIIFYRCDDEKSVHAGRELGISLFQGWSVDDMAMQEKQG